VAAVARYMARAQTVLGVFFMLAQSLCIASIDLRAVFNFV
jgi:hypothetical protein